MASFRKRGPHQWQAQVRKKGYPPKPDRLKPARRRNSGLRK